MTGAWFTHTAFARQSAGSFCHGALLILLLFILKDSLVHMINFMVMLPICHDYLLHWPFKISDKELGATIRLKL